MKDKQIIHVQITQGRPETQALQLSVVENHPEASASGTCKTCAQLNGEPVSWVGMPPFHPHCACTVEWREVKGDE